MRDENIEGDVDEEKISVNIKKSPLKNEEWELTEVLDRKKSNSNTPFKSNQDEKAQNETPVKGTSYIRQSPSISLSGQKSVTKSTSKKEASPIVQDGPQTENIEEVIEEENLLEPIEQKKFGESDVEQRKSSLAKSQYSAASRRQSGENGYRVRARA
jgi:hypothetical protein